MHRTRRRIVFAVFLLLASAGLPAGGAQRPSREEARPVRLAALARSAAVLFWSQLTGLWAKEGCVIDPNGACRAGQSTTETDAGCGIDPHGGCLTGQSTAGTDAGCIADPNGGCVPGQK